AVLGGVKWMPGLQDLDVQMRPHYDLSRGLYISGLYEPLTLLVLKRLLGPGATFLDIGANAGLFSILASRWVEPGGQVYAFEPSEREHLRLRDHLERNRLTNVIAERLAIGRKNGFAPLRVARSPHAGLNTFGDSFAHPGVPAERIETVATMTLDTFVQGRQLKRIDAIKLDIEGSEFDALSNAAEVLEEFRPVLIVELWRAALQACRATPEGLISLVASHRYRLCRIGTSADLIDVVIDEPAPEGNIVAVPVERSML